MAVIRVIGKNGELLSPTTKCDHVRHLLKSGKAKVVGYEPFTIQLTYESANEVNLYQTKGNVITMSKAKTSKNMIIAVGMIMVLALASIAAYFTATDDATNTFTVGKIDIQQLEPNWEPPEDIVPNQEIQKDPQIKNTGENDAYLLEVVRVPHKNIVTSNTTTGERAAAAAKTQLFQLNKTKDSAGANVWTGTDTYHDEAWTLIATDPAGSDTANYVTYVFAYATGGAMTPVAKDATTTPVFESVTFANAVSDQGLEDQSYDIKVNAFGIQKDFIKDNSNGATAPADVWAVLNTQDGAINSLNS